MLAQIILFLLFLPLSIFLILLYLHEHNKNKQNQANLKFLQDKLIFLEQTPQQIRQLAENQSQNLIQHATSQANEIVTSAEVNSLKTTAQAMLEEKLFEEDFKQELLNYQKQIEQTHAKYLQALEQKSLVQQTRVEQALNSKINEVFLNLDQKLTGFLSKSEEKSLDAINLEIKSARQLIDSYRAQQLGLIDENIVAILESTMNLILKKKLTLNDQLDLVFEALEKAKIEKFFA